MNSRASLTHRGFSAPMLVSTAELAQHVSDPGWVIFDCRHDLIDHTKGERLYRDGHIPGAHFAPVESALSGKKTGKNGRHPLPSAKAFAKFLGDHGVSDSSTVVSYDDVGGQYAARLWWMARWIGLTRAALLDGGFPQWTAEGRPVTAKIPTPQPVTLQARVAPDMIWSADQVRRRLNAPDYALIDARSAERYRGEVEPIDPIAGRIPGAVNRFFKTNLNSNLTFRPPAELKREFDVLLGDRAPENVGHHCGSGVTACANLFAMEYAGLPGSKLYVGSWSEWIADASRPIAKG
jgi:thiosulfate/3-mercaptopyruvate sulfurtransferase